MSDMDVKIWGACSECGRPVRLHKGGHVWGHNDRRTRKWPRVQCPGVGKPPAPATEYRERTDEHLREDLRALQDYMQHKNAAQEFNGEQVAAHIRLVLNGEWKL